MIRTELDSMPSELDELNRRIMQLEIEEAALQKETDKLSIEHLADLQPGTGRAPGTVQRHEGQVGK